MKAISASIIVLSGSVLFAVGAAFTSAETQLVACGMGILLGLFGLVTWVIAMGKPS